jgi:hypothetical protein
MSSYKAKQKESNNTEVRHLSRFLEDETVFSKEAEATSATEADL